MSIQEFCDQISKVTGRKYCFKIRDNSHSRRVKSIIEFHKLECFDLESPQALISFIHVNQEFPVEHDGVWYFLSVGEVDFYRDYLVDYWIEII